MPWDHTSVVDQHGNVANFLLQHPPLFYHLLSVTEIKSQTFEYNEYNEKKQVNKCMVYKLKYVTVEAGQ